MLRIKVAPFCLMVWQRWRTGLVAKQLIDGSAGRHIFFFGAVLISVVSQPSCKNSREESEEEKKKASLWISKTAVSADSCFRGGKWEED